MVTPWLCVVYKVTINQVVVPKADGSTHGYVVTPWLCVVYKVTINQVVVPKADGSTQLCGDSMAMCCL